MSSWLLINLAQHYVYTKLKVSVAFLLLRKLEAWDGWIFRVQHIIQPHRESRIVMIHVSMVNTETKHTAQRR